MKKSKLILSTVFLLLITASTYGEDWKKKLEDNKTIQKIEKIDSNDKRVIATGIFIRKVRISRLFFEPDTGSTEILITKSDLEESFKRKNKDIKTMDLTISKDGFLTAKGIAHIMGMDMDVYLEGSFSLDPYKKEITYYITKANVNGFMPVPKSILDKFSKKVNPVFDFDKLGLPLKVTTIIFEKDKIYIR